LNASGFTVASQPSEETSGAFPLTERTFPSAFLLEGYTCQSK